MWRIDTGVDARKLRGIHPGPRVVLVVWPVAGALTHLLWPMLRAAPTNSRTRVTPTPLEVSGLAVAVPLIWVPSMNLITPTGDEAVCPPEGSHRRLRAL